MVDLGLVARINSPNWLWKQCGREVARYHNRHGHSCRKILDQDGNTIADDIGHQAESFMATKIMLDLKPEMLDTIHIETQDGASNMYQLEVKKIKRSWCVVAGESVLGKFRTEEKAAASLKEDFDLYRYWAGSAGVSIENTPAVVRET